MASAPVESAGSAAGSRRLVGALHPQRWASVLTGVLWLVVAGVVLARPPSGVPVIGWRLVFALAPLIGLVPLAAAAAATQVQLTPLGINRARPRRQAIPWVAVEVVRVASSRDRFRPVPGLGWVVTVDRVHPEVVTTGGETIPLREIGAALTEHGLARVLRRAALVATYAGRPTTAPATLADYRAYAASDAGGHWLTT